jgi:hypothetical protein
VLLRHVTDPLRPHLGTWWEPPEDDGPRAGVRPGPCVWVYGRRERVHVAWLDDPAAPRAAPVAHAGVLGDRWWTLDELAASDERFAPARLPALVPAVVRGEYGAAPLVLR